MPAAIATRAPSSAKKTQAAALAAEPFQTHEPLRSQTTSFSRSHVLPAQSISIPSLSEEETQPTWPLLPIQRKLAIGSASDPLEAEADSVAEQVMRVPRSKPASHTNTSAPLSLQRKCACGGSCSKCKGEHSDEDHGIVQRKSAGSASVAETSAPPIVHQVLRSPGHALDNATRAFMEPRFGRDFSNVRIHTDSAASRSARDIQAHAYTVGTNVVFGEGQFAPSTPQGKSLIAHELAHVVQQAGTAGDAVQRKGKKHQETKAPKPEIVKIVAFEGSKDGAVAYVLQPAGPESDAEGSITQELVTIDQNKLNPGEYKLRLDRSAATLYRWVAESGSSPEAGTFTWHNPLVDAKTKEREYGYAETVVITIIPSYIRGYLEKKQGPRGTEKETFAELEAAEILAKHGITNDELLLSRQKVIDARALGNPVSDLDPVTFANKFVADRAPAEAAALDNRKNFLTAANRLSAIRGALDVETTVLFLTDPDLAAARFLRDDIHHVIGTGDPYGFYLAGTDFVDQADLRATITSFANTLDFELRALAQAVLNAAEVGILETDALFTGVFGGTSGRGNLAGELETLDQDPQVKNLVARIKFEQSHGTQDSQPADENESSYSIHQILRTGLPAVAAVVDLSEAAKEEDAYIDTLKQKLNETVVANSQLKVAGLKGFDAFDFLEQKPEKVRSDLSLALADGRRRIGDARRLLSDDSKFVYGADKIIALEKAQLHVTHGSSLDRIIDGIVESRLEEKSTWESIVSVINLLAALPIPPPAGPILRAVAAGINIGQSFNKYAAESIGANTSLKKDAPSAAALGLDFVITATGSVADVASIESHIAESAGHEVSSVDGDLANELNTGRDAETQGAKTVQQSFHLPDPEIDEQAAAELKKTLEEHPPAAKDIHGAPGQREAEFTPGHKVTEVETPTGIHCEIHSEPPGIPADCPAGMGDTAEANAVQSTAGQTQTAPQIDMRGIFDEDGTILIRGVTAVQPSAEAVRRAEAEVDAIVEQKWGQSGVRNITDPAKHVYEGGPDRLYILGKGDEAVLLEVDAKLSISDNPVTIREVSSFDTAAEKFGKSRLEVLDDAVKNGLMTQAEYEQLRESVEQGLVFEEVHGFGAVSEISEDLKAGEVTYHQGEQFAHITKQVAERAKKRLSAEITAIIVPPAADRRTARTIAKQIVSELEKSKKP
jgi:hypothetical protein